MRDTLNPEVRAALERERDRLKQEHRDLDAAIMALEALHMPDRLQIQRLKRRKLALKDRLTELNDQLLPDIIA